MRGRIPALRGTDNGETTPGYSEVTLDEAAKKVVDQSIAAVDAWLIAEPQERTLILPPCNGFHRRVLFQELPKK